MPQYIKPKFLFSLLLLYIVATNVVWANQATIDSLRATIEPNYKEQKTLEILKVAAKNSFNDIERALAYTEIALHRARLANNLEGQYQTLRERGFILEENNRVEKALQAFEQAKIIAENLSSSTHRLSIYTDLAIVHKKLGNYKSATDYHQLTLSLAQKLGNLEMIADSYHGLGSIYDVVGDYDKAIEYYYNSLETFKKRKGVSGIEITLQNISSLYLKTKNTQQALTTIQKAYKIAQSSPDSLILADVLNGYGRILAEIGDYDLALIRLNNSLRISSNVGNKVAIVNVLIEIADVYSKKGELETADKFFNKCFEFKEYISTKNQAILYNKLGNLNQIRGEFKEAASFYEKSLALDDKLENNHLSQKNNYSLYEIKKAQGETQSALMYLEGYNKLQEQILDKEKTQRIAEKRFQYEMEKSEQTIQELASSRNRSILLGISFTLLVIITFLFFTNKMKHRNNYELKSKHEEIQFQNKKLTESNEVLRQFAYAAAHDLKEPLRNIGSFISLIRKRYSRDMPEDANTYMGYVVKGVNRMNDLLLDLLEFSSITTEKASSELINVGTVLDEVVYSLHDKIISSNTIIDYSNNLPKLKMKRLHLFQLFQNIITNSIKFNSRNPEIKIEVNEEKEKDCILICIEDNGIGMEKAYEQKIFLLFHQLDKQTGYEGTGIGLTICKNIIEKYNGQIWFDSTLGEGTKFFIRLPNDPENPSLVLRQLREEMRLDQTMAS